MPGARGFAAEAGMDYQKAAAKAAMLTIPAFRGL